MTHGNDRRANRLRLAPGRRSSGGILWRVLVHLGYNR